MSFSEKLHLIEQILNAHGLKTTSLSEDRKRAIQTGAEWYPCELIHPDNNNVVVFFTWDDCNVYQHEGYYKEKLEEINSLYVHDLRFDNIFERYSDDGALRLTFELNGAETVLAFNVLNDTDYVPNEFTDFVHQLLTSYYSQHFFSFYVGPNGEFVYYLMPNEIANDLAAASIPTVTTPLKECAQFSDMYSEIVAGSKVRHSVFGVGRVSEKYIKKENEIVDVQFESGERKSLVLQYAKLSIMEK